MADLIVRQDLVDLVNDLTEIISQFKGALDFENDNDRVWGQWNANASMGDFADNWTVHRDAMVKDMESLRDAVRQVNDAWADADRQLTESLQAS